MIGQTSQEIAQKLLEEAVAYGQVVITGEDEQGRTLYEVAA